MMLEVEAGWGSVEDYRAVSNTCRPVVEDHQYQQSVVAKACAVWRGCEEAEQVASPGAYSRCAMCARQNGTSVAFGSVAFQNNVKCTLNAISGAFLGCRPTNPMPNAHELNLLEND